MSSEYQFRKECILKILFLVACLGLSSCSYSPPKQRVVMDQVVRAGDTYTGYVLLKTMEFREPTGFINTFPNGGQLWKLSQQVQVYQVHAQDLSHRLLANLRADETTWESFSGHIIGFDDNKVPYLQLSGCEKGGECYGDLINFKYFRLNPNGSPELLSELPPNDGLPPIMGSRRQGEVNFVRFSISRDTLKAKFKADGNYQPLYIADQEGNLVTVD